ncbi:MAG: ATP-binding cassette domain-containing protein [Myxococcales bacterium]|nr:ATP-binding cassette domain-containing protein [Myxococcales bacterium]
MTLLLARGLRVEAASAEVRPPLPGPVDLRLAAGQRLALEGPSGSGKTTLLRALSLLEPLGHGEIELCGEPVREGQEPAYRRRVHYLAQQSARLALSAEAWLEQAFIPRSAGGCRFERDRALSLCERLGLERALVGRSLAELSGGELQRVALVRALLVEPWVLLLDEPTSALDDAARERFEHCLGDWLEQGQRALVLVSHDPAQRQRLCDHRRVFSADGTLGATEVLS